MKQIQKIQRRVFGALGKTFRGGIAENCLRFRFEGTGYDSMDVAVPEQDRHIWLSSCRHLTGPFLALLDPMVRLVHIIGATQVLKSIAGDAWVVYAMEHIQKSMLVLFDSEDKADLYCEKRLMETLKNHPVLSKMFEEAKKEDRHAVCGTWIKTALATLLVAGLNDKNASTISWEYIWLSEMWLTGNSGLQWKAYKRTDRFPDTHKILNESQASMVGTDLHISAREAHQVPLRWPCLACGGFQTWEWQHWNFKRPADFVPRDPEYISSLAGLACIISEPPKPNTFAGMKFLDDGGGTNSILERAKSAYWECIWCGFHINDTRAIRQSLMDNYEQNYQITKRNPENESPDSKNKKSEIRGSSLGFAGEFVTPAKVTFTLPFESARDNRFSKTVEEFLIAKHEERQGNKVRLANWFMADRAIFFSEEILQPHIISAVEIFNPAEKIANWHHDGMIVDCQKDPILDTVGTFHYCIFTADKYGNSFEMARGFAGSWGEWIALQKKFKVKNENVQIDGRKWTFDILEKAAENRELVDGIQFGRPVKYFSCWNVLLGDDARQFPWPSTGPAKIYKLWSPPTRRIIQVTDAKGNRFGVSVFMTRWSNISVKDLLAGILIGGEGKVKFIALPRESLATKDQMLETGTMTYDSQMSSEVRTEKNGKPTYEKISNRPNHRWDIASMRIVALLRKNLIGYVAMEETK